MYLMETVIIYLYIFYWGVIEPNINVGTPFNCKNGLYYFAYGHSFTDKPAENNNKSC